ncbi:helix-turn-helix domain-containing protein [Flavisolibacter tropicus]|uniref:helix-turn-helix domain-containing protein n=1 Tax=Flavisolibacter tropicus TaxID=1492898 RepID=UPI000830685E|nr:helix-turn-helix domain-containing protein [Flavisolibacter tropicus]
MSSNIRIVKICEYCKNEFIAKKTTSKTCSDPCAKRLYKLNQKNKKIAQAELKTEISRRPEGFINEELIKVIQAKELLTLKEAAILLNITPLTLRRWVLGGKINSEKIGKKHIFKKENISNLVRT